MRSATGLLSHGQKIRSDRGYCNEEDNVSINNNNHEQHSYLLFEVPTTEPTQQVHTTTKLRKRSKSKRSETTAVARKIARKKASMKASPKVSIAELPEGETRTHQEILEQRHNNANLKGKNYHLSDELDM